MAAAGTSPARCVSWRRNVPPVHCDRSTFPKSRWRRLWRWPTCRTRTCLCVPAASTASATSCCGNSPTPSCTLRIACGRISMPANWMPRWLSLAPASGASGVRRSRRGVPRALKTRILTAAVLIGLLLVVLLWLPPWATVVAVTALILAGAWEWSAFLKLQSLAGRVLFVAVVAASLPLLWQLTVAEPARLVVLYLALLWWLVAL